MVLFMFYVIYVNVFNCNFFVLYITIDIIYGEARGKIGRYMGMKNGEFHGDFMGDFMVISWVSSW